MTIDFRPVADFEIPDFLRTLLTAFGRSMAPEAVERARNTPEFDVRYGAFDEGACVGSAGSFSVGMTVPGGASVPTSGVTHVGVLPTHHRRGILTALMRCLFDEAKKRDQPIAVLFASEGTIYGRFGYGMASLGGDMVLPKASARFAAASGPGARARLVSEQECVPFFAEVWERVRAVTPGMLTRSEGWWRTRRVSDPDYLRAGRAPLQRVLLELEGRPAAYALYRAATWYGRYLTTGTLDVVEAIGDSPDATHALWRYLLAIDLIDTVSMGIMPVDHPLFFLLSDPRQMRMSLADALWIRLLDIPRALSERRYTEGAPLVFDVTDPFCPENTGRYLLADGAARRTDAAPDLSLDASALASTYLGAFRFTQLALAGRIVEHTKGALRRADLLFDSERAPWCPEIF